MHNRNIPNPCKSEDGMPLVNTLSMTMNKAKAKVAFFVFRNRRNFILASFCKLWFLSLPVLSTLFIVIKIQNTQNEIVVFTQYGYFTLSVMALLTGVYFKNKHYARRHKYFKLRLLRAKQN
jgi:hypothetical protein